MVLINFENSNIKVIPAKHLYIVDKDGIQQKVKYIKEREWWNHIFSENININSAQMINQSDIKEIPPHRFLDFFNVNNMAFQAKAIYFIDSNGNAIEFINPIHKDWVNDYVTEDNFNNDFKPDIPLALSENLVNINDAVSEVISHTDYLDIPIDISENLVTTLNTIFGQEGIDITLIPIFLLNIAINVSENLNYSVNNPINNDSVSITLTPI